MTTESNMLNDLSGKDLHSSLIDYKRIGYRSLRYWYLVVISLAIAIAIAFYNNRYSQRIYPVYASIIIREREETTGAELLYKNSPLIDQYRNYLNEPYIIRSYPLIERVVEELNFGMTFYREGFFMTTEAYDFVPVRAKLIKIVKSNGGRFIMNILSENRISLEVFGGSKIPRQEFNLNENIVYAGYELRFERIKDRELENLINVPFLLVIDDPFSVASEYVSKLAVDWAEEGSGVINITVSGPNPKKEIDFINGLVNNYQKYDLEKKNQTADRTVKFINKQLIKISDSLRLFEGQLQKFKANNKTSGNLGQEAQRIFSKVEVLEAQKGELLMKENYYEYLRKYIGESKNLDQVILPTSLGINDPVLTSLITKLVDLQLELKLLVDRKMENPIVTSRLQRLAELRHDITESLLGLKATDQIKLDFVNSQIAVAERQMDRLPSAERQLITIQRNYSLLENLYVFLMQKMSEAEISQASNVSDIIMVNPPRQGGATSPKVSRNYLMAVTAGLLIPFMLFVAFELLNNKVQSREDIEKLTSAPFLGGIGHNPIESNLIVQQKPKSAVSESFRALRSNLNFFTGNETNKIFMISSSISGEGKTFTTINLATVFALSGKKTLIIGADMRRPKIFSDFELSNEKGLSGFLSNLNTFEEVVQSTKITNLDLVSGGPVPPNPSELLLTPRFESFLTEAKKRYDYVLIDTPPLALVTDAFVMSKYSDHTVFVMRQNYTPKSFIRAIEDYSKNGRIPRVSILLNDIYKSGLGYGYGVGYGYNYAYSYGYGYGYRKRSRDGAGYYDET